MANHRPAADGSLISTNTKLRPHRNRRRSVFLQTCAAAAACFARCALASGPRRICHKSPGAPRRVIVFHLSAPRTPSAMIQFLSGAPKASAPPTETEIKKPNELWRRRVVLEKSGSE